MYLERENKSTAYSTRKRGTVRCIVHVGVLGWVLPSQAMCCELPRPQVPVIGKLATRGGEHSFCHFTSIYSPTLSSLYLECWEQPYETATKKARVPRAFTSYGIGPFARHSLENPPIFATKKGHLKVWRFPQRVAVELPDDPRSQASWNDEIVFFTTTRLGPTPRLLGVPINQQGLAATNP